MPAGLASLVLQVQVFFSVGLAVAFLGERLRPAQVAGAAVAFAGFAVIAAGPAETAPPWPASSASPRPGAGRSATSAPAARRARARSRCSCGRASSRRSPWPASAFTLLVPVVGIGSAWLLPDEVPNGPELLGAVLVLAGLALNT